MIQVEQTAPETTPLLNTAGLLVQLDGARTEVAMAVAAYKPSEGNFTKCIKHVLRLCGDAWKQFEHTIGQTLSSVNTEISATLAQWPAEKGKLISQRDQDILAAGDVLRNDIKAAVRKELDAEEGVQSGNPGEEPDNRTALQKTVDTLLYNLQTLIIRETGWLGGKILLESMKTVKRVAYTFGAIYAVSEIVSGYVYFQAKGDQVGAFFMLVLLVLIGTALADFSGIHSKRVTTNLNARSNFKKHFLKGVDDQGNKVFVNPLEWGDLIIGPGGFIALLGLTWVILNFRLGESNDDEVLKGTDIRAILVSLGLLVNWFVVFVLAPRHSEAVQQEHFEAKAKYDEQKAELDAKQAETAQAGHETAPTEPMALAVHNYRLAVEAAQEPLKTTLDTCAGNFLYRSQLLAAYRDAHRVHALPACRRQINALIDGIGSRLKTERVPFDETAFRQQHAGEISALPEKACPRRLENTDLDARILAFDLSFPPAQGILTTFDDVVEEIRAAVTKQRREEKATACEQQLKGLDDEG